MVIGKFFVKSKRVFEPRRKENFLIFNLNRDWGAKLPRSLGGTKELAPTLYKRQF